MVQDRPGRRDRPPHLPRLTGSAAGARALGRPPRAHGGTAVVKLFLHISRDEQGTRLEERATLPQKRWKLQASDFAERALWNEYQQAYADAIAATNTAGAPWYLIPANHKWYRNWAVTTVLIETLEHLNPRYPTPPDRGSRAPSPVT